MTDPKSAPKRAGKQLAIGVDKNGWWRRFVEAAKRLDLDHKVVDVESADWLTEVRECAYFIWRPNLDPPYWQEAHEKLYFLSEHAGIRTFPNWATFWHYNNKRAQSYLFSHYDVPAPRTSVSFSAEAAHRALSSASFPLVSKTSGGASSVGVRLLTNRRQAEAEIRTAFHRGLIQRVLAKCGVTWRWTPRRLEQYLLWQEFIDGNDRDLRVTVIGKEHVFAFWRYNRPNDFRASGSGKLDYETEGVDEALRFCRDLCIRLDFDVMAFDLLFSEGRFLVVEISYTFSDTAIHNAPHHFCLDDSGEVRRIDGHHWPQDLLMDYVAGVMSLAEDPRSGLHTPGRSRATNAK